MSTPQWSSFSASLLTIFGQDENFLEWAQADILYESWTLAWRPIALQSWLETDLKPRFSGRVLPIDEATADRWGAITGGAAAQGITVPVIDGLLAATALQHNLTLVTRSTKNLTGTNVPAFNPGDL